MSTATETAAAAVPAGCPAPPSTPAPPSGPPQEPRAARGWRYADHAGASKRDLRLDFLRGFAVFAMVVDHIGGASWLYAVTGGNRFFVSAAEGFVFISGGVVGIVYGARARAGGLRVALPRLLERSWTLYALAVWLAIGTAFVAAVFQLPGGAHLGEAPARFVFEVVTLQRTYYLVDVMLLYAFVMALAPFALALLLRRRWWLLALASWGLWAGYQLFPRELTLPWPITHNPVFQLASWQVLFFTGMILGYERDWLARNVAAFWPRSPLRDGWLLPLAALLGLLIWLHATNGAPLAPYLPDGDAAGLLDEWFDKRALPFARLVACVLVFAFAWALVTRCWQPLRRAAGWFLLPLGQGALYAYAAHLFLVPLVQLGVFWSWGAGEDGGYPDLPPGVNAVLQVAALSLLWALTRARFLGSVVAPLGSPPLARWRPRTAGPTIWRPSDSLAVILLVVLVSATLVAPGGASTVAGPQLLPQQSAGPEATASPQAGGGRRPAAGREPTVIAPRKVAGPATGSAGAQEPVPTPTAPAAAGQSTRSTPPPQPTQVAQSAAGLANAEMNVATPRLEGASARSATPAAVTPGYLKDGEFYSRALGRTMPYGIYLPPGYEGGSRSYPVLYMLHGGGGHYSEWVEYGLPEAAEHLIAAGSIPPLIIVMPQGDHSFWVNHAGSDDERWGDYLVSDLVTHIDATYRTITQAGARAIGGLSMGGFGALQLAFSHPDVFGAVGAHSPSLRFWEDTPEFLGEPEYFATIDPVELAGALTPEQAARIWLDVGEEDRWSARVVALHNILEARGVAHEFQLTPGDHDAAYWSSHVGAYLRFYTSAFNGRR